ncbi:MFS transporter [Paenibacillus cellulositrophicus]|uniref:MFS transporter n=1 Tax=Paenibacillus cellulositrophicus TaxID=562959 RepID=UPI003F7E22E0
MKPSPEVPRPLSSPLRPLLVLSLCAFAIGMAEFVIMGILPDIASNLQVTISDAGLLISGYSLGVAVTAPLIMILTGRLPRKTLLLLLMLLFVISNALAVSAQDFSVLMTARILMSLTHGSFFGVATVMAAEMVTADKRAWAISVLVSGSSIANIAGVPFGTWVGHALGWRYTFAAIAVIGAAALAGLFRLLPGHLSTRPAPLKREISVLGKPEVLLALLVSALCFGGVFMTFTYVAPLLEQLAMFDGRSVSWILVLFGIGVTIGNVAGGRLADWRLRPALIGITAGLAICLFAFTVTLESKIFAVADIFLLGVFSFGILPCLTVLVMSKAKEAPNLATTMNVSALHISNAVGAWLGGMVIDSRFGLRTVPLFSGGVTLLGLMLIVFMILLETRRKRIRRKQQQAIPVKN